MGFQQESCYSVSKQFLQNSNSLQNMHHKVTLSPVIHCNCCKAQERILYQPQNAKTPYTQQKYFLGQQKPSRFNDCKHRFNYHGQNFKLNRNFNSKESLKITIENPAFNRGYAQKNVAYEPITNRGQGGPNKCNNCEKNLYKRQGQNRNRNSSQDPKWHSEESHFQQIPSYGVENTVAFKGNAHKHMLGRSKSFVDYCPQKLLSSVNKKSSVTDKIEREDYSITASFKKLNENNKPLKISEAISLHMKDNLNEKEKPTATNQGSVLEQNLLCAKNLDRNKRPLKISEAIALHIEDNLKEKEKPSLMNPVESLASEMGDDSKKSFFIDNEYYTGLDGIVQQFYSLKISSEPNRDCKENKPSLKHYSISSKNCRKESINQMSTDISIHSKDMEKVNVRPHVSETLEFQNKTDIGQNIMLFEKISLPNGNYNDRQKLHRSKSSIDFYPHNASSQRSSSSTNIPDFNKIYLPQKNLKNSEVAISSLKDTNLGGKKDYHNVKLGLKINENSFQQPLSNSREVIRSNGKYSAQERLLALKSKSSDRDKLSTPSTCTESTALMEKINFNSNTQMCQLKSIEKKKNEAPRISSSVQQRLMLHTFQN